MKLVRKKDTRKLIKELMEKYGFQHERNSKVLRFMLEHDEDFINAHTVLLYYSLPEEVDIRPLVHKYADEKRILLPVVKGKDLELRVFNGELQPGPFNILEPVGEAFTDFEAIELVIVPGLAFDAKGNRLGRGKGYYDRLLPKLPHAKKVGICFPYQKLRFVPHFPFDIPMDKVISLR